jgi:hypothetical protein
VAWAAQTAETVASKLVIAHKVVKKTQNRLTTVLLGQNHIIKLLRGFCLLFYDDMRPANKGRGVGNF